MLLLERGFNPKDLIFSEKVREMCFSCKRYGYSIKCPPFLRSIRYYKRLTHSYKYGKIIVFRYIIDKKEDYKDLGKRSSLELMNYILKERDALIGKSKFYMGASAGSCKRCDKCNLERCNYPAKSLIPIEGMGVDVVDLVKKVGNIDIKFPVDNQGFLYRVGILLWD